MVRRIQSRKHKRNKQVNAKKAKRLLELCTYENTKIFYPKLCYAKVLKVYDGDTIWVASFLLGKGKHHRVCRFNLRMLGYDSAELRSSNVIEKYVARKARDALTQHLFDKLLYVEIQDPNTIKKRDPYGRLLATVWIAEKGKKYEQSNSVNQWMVDNRYGVPYDGKGKRPETDWAVYYTE